MAQNYGFRKEWEEHFAYLLPFFRDERYIRIDGKPLFLIYRPGEMRQGKYMARLWNRLAAENGLPGIFIMGMRSWEFETDSCKWLDAKVDYEPTKEQRNRIIKKYVLRKGQFKDLFDFGLYNRIFCNVQDYGKINREMLRAEHGAGMIGQIVVPYIIEAYGLQDCVECYVDMDKRKAGKKIPIGSREYEIKPPDALNHVVQNTAIR